jgi:hypothetical protein
VIELVLTLLFLADVYLWFTWFTWPKLPGRDRIILGILFLVVTAMFIVVMALAALT